MQALTTVFTAPPWCSNRFAVFIDNNPSHSSILSPSRGWADPSFSRCVPSQYTSRLQTLSPGVCPGYMSIVKAASTVDGSKTLWAGGCCQSGFSDMSGYFCTSSITTPMAFLLLPNITTRDIYTTLSNLWIEHDQITVAWEETDLKVLPTEVVTHYASIMNIAVGTTTSECSTTPLAMSPTGARTSSTVAKSTSAGPTRIIVTPVTIESTVGTSTTPAESSESTTSSHTSSSGGPQISRRFVIPIVLWIILAWLF